MAGYLHCEQKLSEALELKKRWNLWCWCRDLQFLQTSEPGMARVFPDADSGPAAPNTTALLRAQDRSEEPEDS